MDLIVEAFSAMPQKQLVVIGDGPELEKVKRKAGRNVEILGYQPFQVLQDLMRRARAFVFAGEEDFGITVVEAQACGTPVIAYGKGGALETVIGAGSHAKPTGVFFPSQTVWSLIEGVNAFERQAELFAPEHCRQNALRFSRERFRREIASYIEQRRAAWSRGLSVVRGEGEVAAESAEYSEIALAE
jgi:glycosyltransferase involved in cell wall biosynthesis